MRVNGPQIELKYTLHECMDARGVKYISAHPVMTSGAMFTLLQREVDH